MSKARMSKVLKNQGMRNRFQRVQALRVQALLEGAQSSGVSGVVQTVYRMIDPDQPSAECIEQADADFASASTPEEVWDAALGMAECLREAELEVVVEPEDPPEPHPVPGKAVSAGNLVLAALLVLLHDQAKTIRPKVT
jgi:hypothetical protein